ncbi:MAG: RagB/SusD family nutrient uptake outer membrane protein, partial [Muribaculaceae bacterium]|nr:RagB/SusD family nutrient uptake outer membrane protein [Muribaculaceae bacterium]
MALAMTLLGVVTSSWAGNFNLPEVADVNDVFAAPAVFKAGAQAPQFTLQPVIVGDVNHDGTMNITDVTELIDALLSNNDYGLNGDVDGDGNVNISDVTDLIDRLLSGTVETRLGTGELASAMNNIYRMLRTAGWSSTGNTHQAFGILAHTLTAELMGDDMIMGAQGSGWFWFDATYNVKSRYTSSSWRSYDLWNTYYTCIAEANSIISQKNNITGSTDLVNYYVGQAYALRAYSYFMLSQWFARTYKGHESDPCVPLFTGTVFNGSTGQPRATVTQVYAQIDSDIQQAVNLLKNTTQLSPSHIGYAVALGLRSRIYLVEEKWNNAYIAARDA